MKYALYLGCAITTEAYSYEMSARETLTRLGVEFVDSGAGRAGLWWVFLIRLRERESERRQEKRRKSELF